MPKPIEKTRTGRRTVPRRSARRSTCWKRSPRSAVRRGSSSSRRRAACLKGTLYRFLQSLTRQGMLSYEPERSASYFLGMRLVRLAHAAWKQSSLAPGGSGRTWMRWPGWCAADHPSRSARWRACALLSTSSSPSRPVEMFSSAGKVGPAYCTGIGKAMLVLSHTRASSSARLSQQSFYRFTEQHAHQQDGSARRSRRHSPSAGFALDNEEHERGGIICVAGANPLRARASLWVACRSRPFTDGWISTS